MRSACRACIALLVCLLTVQPVAASINFNDAGQVDAVDHGSAAGLDDLPTADFSWGCVVNRTSNGNSQYVIAKATAGTTGWYVFIGNGGGTEGQLNVVAGGVTTHLNIQSSAGTVVALNTPTYIGGSFDVTGGTMALYGGALTSYTALSAFAQTGTSLSGGYNSDAAANLLIGNGLDDGAVNTPFLGTIERCFIVKSELTAAQHDARKHAYLTTWIASCELVVSYLDNTDVANKCTATLGSHNGTLEGAAPSAVSALGDKLLDVTSAQLYASAANWYSDGAGALGANNIKGSSTYIQTTRTGAFFRFPVVINNAATDGGICWGHFDTSSLASVSAGNAPLLRVRYSRSNGGDERASYTVGLAYNANITDTRVLLSPISTTTNLEDGTYQVEVYFDAISLVTPGDRWGQDGVADQSVKFTSIECDETATVGTVSYDTDFCVFIGDSLIEGADAQGTDTERASNSAFYGPARSAARALGCEASANGFGGIGIVEGMGNQAVSSTYPALYSGTDANKAWDKYHSGAAISWTNTPYAVFITGGLNDAGCTTVTAADYTALIDDVRTKVGNAAYIFLANYPLIGSSVDACDTLMATAIKSVAVTARTTHLSGILKLHAANTARGPAFTSDDNLTGAGGSTHLNKIGGYEYALSLVAGAREYITRVTAGRSTTSGGN